MRPCAVAACILASPIAFASQSETIRLGRWITGSSILLDASADGNTVVGNTSPADFRDRPIIFRLGETPTVLEFSIASAWGSSGDGAVVVGEVASTNQSWRWTQQHGAEFFAFERARDVSCDGSLSTGSLTSAWRYTAANGLQRLGQYPGWNGNAGAYCTTVDGSAIGGYVSRSSELSKAAYWSLASGWQLIGTEDDGYESGFTNDLNPDGTVVVGSVGYTSGNSSDIVPFRWTAQTGIQLLGPFTWPNSNAEAVSADGKIVVGIREFAGSFIWIEGRGTLDFKQYLLERGFTDLPRVPYIYGMSADGRVFVGYDDKGGENLEGIVFIDRGPRGVYPSTFAVTRGLPQGGTKFDAWFGDHKGIEARQRPALAPTLPEAQVEVAGKSLFATASSLRFHLRASCDAAPSSLAMQRLELYRYSTGSWVILDERRPTRTESELFVDAPTPGDFVDPLTQGVRARVSWFAPSSLAPNWGVHVDRAAWEIDGT